MDITIKRAQERDYPRILELIKELAEYERAPGEVGITLEELIHDGKGKHPLFFVDVAEVKDHVIGMALYYIGYSTWKGKMLYLDDLIVNEAYRKQGVGQLLFESVIKASQEMKVKQIRWHVLDWNEPAIKFYEKVNASLDPEWITGKFSETQIQNYEFKD